MASVRILPGPPLGTAPGRTRPVGRIGGAIPLPALAAALGSNCQLLSLQNPLVADWDACWLDEQLITNLAQWGDLIAHNRWQEVEGAFALAWLDDSGAVHLARDAIGERTLYYAETREGLIFASTLPAILATGLVPPKLYVPAVAAYLTYAYIPGADTLIAGVSELLPGQHLTYRQGSCALRYFWTLPADTLAPAEAGPLQQGLRQELERVVRQRLPLAGPVGATLSGGIDSSLVVALAARFHPEPIHTYSISFGPQYRNELPFSSLVADHCRTLHRVLELSPEVVLHYLDQAIALLSKPIGDPLTVPNALVFREAAAEVGIVLNGEGGDPCFGGPKNGPMLLAELLGDQAREDSYLRAHQKCYDDLPDMLEPDVWQSIGYPSLTAFVTPYFASPRWQGFVSKLMAINVACKGGHHILPKVEQCSAPFGVLPRSPLFARSIVEAAFAIPPQLKLRGTVEKYLLKQAVADLLPDAILQRPKSGMLVPVEAWFQGPLLPQARERLLEGLVSYGLFQRTYLEKLLQGRLGGLRPRHGAKIWLLVTLEAWLRSVAAIR